MIHDSVIGCVGSTPMVNLRRLFPGPDVEVLAKLEFLNPWGSLKDRPARHIIERGLQSGLISPGASLVESTSGNFGVSLAAVCKMYSLKFTAVVDPHITHTNLAVMKLLGAHIEMVTSGERNGGYLEARIDRVREIIKSDPNVLWINQYANTSNSEAHFETTGEEIASAIDGNLDFLVAAVSSSGTIMGTARRLRQKFPKLGVIGVDMVGSVIFGGPPSRRNLPGIGSTRRPELLQVEEIDRVIHVTEADTVQGCHSLLEREAILAGASSGSVVAAIKKIVDVLPKPARIVTILPDRGERYLDKVFGTAEPLASSSGIR